MKLNKTVKKPKKQFNPIYHWYVMLLTFTLLAMLVVAYSVYSFSHIKNEIISIDQETQNNAQNSSSTEMLEKSRSNTKFLKDINNLNKTLEEFNKKETEYEKLVKSAVAAPVFATTTSSTTIATSTN